MGNTESSASGSAAAAAAGKQDQPQQQKEQQKDNNNNNNNNVRPRNESIVTSLRTTIQDIFGPNGPNEPKRLPPKRHPPKQMLFGCTTVDEHYDYIETAVALVSDLEGKEGLEALGFEYRMVHHPETCCCLRNTSSDVDDDDDDLTNSEIGYDEDKEDLDDESTNEDDNDDDDDDGYGQFDLEEERQNSDQGPSSDTEGKSFMVPVGSPLKKKFPEEEETTTLQNNGLASPESISASGAGAGAAGSKVEQQYPYNPNNNSYSSPYNSKNVSRSTSAVSLFSLATHNTDFSGGSSLNTSRHGGANGNNGRRPGHQHHHHHHSHNRFPLASVTQPSNQMVFEEDSCALRLHHVRSGEMITPSNHLKYMADGKMYDELSRLCMEYAQQVMLEEGNLQWKTLISSGSNSTYDDDMNGKKKNPENGNAADEDNKIFGAMVSHSYLERLERGDETDDGKNRNTLLIITGKGQVRAGIFSRRHLLVTSMEAATALPFIREAQSRDMDIVMLDPNALGYRMGMDVVETSLTKLFLQSRAVQQEGIYILAHSMAGAQIVRFLTNNSSSYTKPPAGNGNIANASEEPHKNAGSRESFRQRIQAIAFTDSNHNINWTKQFPDLTEMLTGTPSLYIKSHKVHEKAKELGEAHHDCQFWRHRFGTIKTLWAGTHEHALTNYTARGHIWEHFDAFLNKAKDDNNRHEEKTKDTPS